jgi:hypothetical protein
MQTALSFDALVVKLSRRNNGLVRTQDLVAAHHSEQSITRRLAIGALQPVIRGVVAPVGFKITDLRRSHAAALVSNSAWVSHLSALQIHGATLSGHIEGAHMSSSERVRHRGVLVHQLDQPAPMDLSKYFGVKASRPALALVESSKLLKERELAVALDSLVLLRVVSLQDVQRCVEARGRFPGIVCLRMLLAERLDGAGMLRSFLEYDLDRLLKRCQLPPGIRNYRVRLPGGGVRELDRAWPEQRVALEAESWKHHSNTTDWGRSRTKDRLLTAHGWTMLAAVVEDIRSPHRLLSDLARVLNSRLPFVSGG